MGSFFVSLGIGLTMLLVLFVIGSVLSEESVDPEEDDEDDDDTDLHTPTADVSTDAGEWVREQLRSTEAA